MKKKGLILCLVLILTMITSAVYAEGEIIVRIEEEFDLQVDDEAAENVKTVGDLVKCIEANLK